MQDFPGANELIVPMRFNRAKPVIFGNPAKPQVSTDTG